jgi:DNA-binding transcriptional ArsR family regulator
MVYKKSASALKAEILSALAHPNRIRIIEYLGKEVRCNCELAPALDLEQSLFKRAFSSPGKRGCA